MVEKICKECLISKTLDQYREHRNMCKKCSYQKTKKNKKKSKKKKKDYNLFEINKKNLFEEIIIDKLCSRCDIIKNINDFRHGRSYCKDCDNKRTIEYRTAKRKEFTDNTINKKICIKCNIEKFNTNFIVTGGNVCNDCNRKYHRDKKNKKIEIKKIIINDNNEKQCSKCNQFKLLDDYVNGNNMCHYCRCNYYTEYFKNNMIAKIKNNLATHMRLYFKKENRTFEYVNIERELFMKWFEFLYTYDEYINNDNHGSYWEIDHVVPCKLFNMENEEEIKLCYNWKNLQCLSAYLNCKKNKYFKIGYLWKQEILVKKFNSLYNVESIDEINLYYSRICAKLFREELSEAEYMREVPKA